MEQEIWKDINGYEGYYQISNLGRVKSLKRKNVKNEKFLSPTIRNGYYIHTLQYYHHSKTLRRHLVVHRLIAEHFIPNPDNKPCVNHIDGNPLNNSIDNLEWVTLRENSCHAQNSKLRSSKYIGVHKTTKKNKPWRAHININGKKLSLGCYYTEEEAYAARIQYEKDNGIENKYL